MLLDQPSGWVARFAPLIPPGEVLDLACGGGRHARFLAALGHPVLAVDRDPEALGKACGPAITALQIDLEGDGPSWPFETERFAGIVVTNYLHRPLFPHILRSISQGGVLIYETFAKGNEQFGKPSSPLFLLEQCELVNVVTKTASPLRIVAYEDGYIELPRPAMVQRICAVKSNAESDLRRLRLS